MDGCVEIYSATDVSTASSTSNGHSPSDHCADFSKTRGCVPMENAKIYLWRYRVKLVSPEAKAQAEWNWNTKPSLFSRTNLLKVNVMLWGVPCLCDAKERQIRNVRDDWSGSEIRISETPLSGCKLNAAGPCHSLSSFPETRNPFVCNICAVWLQKNVNKSHYAFICHVVRRPSPPASERRFPETIKWMLAN